MWCKTQDGNLVNLANAASVQLDCYPMTSPPKEWRLVAKNELGDWIAKLALFNTEAKAKTALNDLHDWLRGDAVGCDFSAK